jgi:hypothetical protein
MYRQQFHVSDNQLRPDDITWTGAEIRSYCRLAALLDISLHQAAKCRADRIDRGRVNEKVPHLGQRPLP